MLYVASPRLWLVIVIPTDTHTFQVADRLVTAGLRVVVRLLTLVLPVLSVRTGHLLWTTGASVISRVMGIILATVAVDATLGGLDAMDTLNIAPVEDAPTSAA